MTKHWQQLWGLALLALATCNLQPSTASAQGTAFTYQGRLQNNGSPVNGLYDFRFRLGADPQGNNYVGSAYLTNGVGVSNGLFITTMDFGPGAFNGSNYWLEVDVRTNGAGGYTALSPLQALTPTPYAILASNLSGVLPAAQLGGTIASANLPASPTVSGTVTAGAFAGNGASVTNVNAQALNGLNATNFWQTAGNGGTASGVNYLGTADNQRLVVKVYGQEVVRYEPTTDTPSIVGGYAGNTASGLEGVTIAGGGTAIGTQPNVVGGVAHFGTIGGGYNNTALGYGAGVFAGSVNIAGGNFSLVGEGQFNTNWGNYAVIGGGMYNSISSNSDDSLIGGGFNNVIQTNCPASVIAGGTNNQIQLTNKWSAIGGGSGNIIQPYSQGCNIGGGENNLIATVNYDSSIGGGLNNLIDTNANVSVIAGGWHNWIQPYTSYSFIGGGASNTVQVGQSYNFIGGGIYNNAGSGGWTVIGGGQANTANARYSAVLGGYMDAAVGTNAAVVGGYNNYAYGAGAFIGGGINNVVMADDGTVAGGSYNRIDYNNFSPNSGEAFIGGGDSNVINTNSYRAVIGGGLLNGVNNSYESFIGGGVVNTILNAFRSSISGGEQNTIQGGSDHSLIGGGLSNVINSNDYNAAIVGGYLNVISNFANTSFIGGGQANTVAANRSFIGGGVGNIISAGGVYGVIGGGELNTNSGNYATIPGGYQNVAAGQTSFAAGNRAKANYAGDFVWGDSQAVDFNATASDQFLVRAQGGIGLNTTSVYTNVTVNGAIGFLDSDKPMFLMYQQGNLYAGRMIISHSPGFPGWGLYYNDLTDQFVFTNNTAPIMSVGLGSGKVGIGTVTPGYLFTVGSSGTPAYCNGTTWVNGSDRNSKQDFAPLSATEVLAKVVALPVQSWSYKAQPGDKHIGPVAQDFHAAFGLNGDDDKHIATVDEGGVALAAIQGLNQKLEAENAELKQRLAKLETLVQQMATQK
jgi:Chaperone of endosialidase